MWQTHGQKGQGQDGGPEPQTEHAVCHGDRTGSGQSPPQGPAAQDGGAQAQGAVHSRFHG